MIRASWKASMLPTGGLKYAQQGHGAKGSMRAAFAYWQHAGCGLRAISGSMHRVSSLQGSIVH